MSDHQQEIVALCQAIGVAIGIHPGDLLKEEEEKICNLISGFTAPLIGRERVKALRWAANALEGAATGYITPDLLHAHARAISDIREMADGEEANMKAALNA